MAVTTYEIWCHTLLVLQTHLRQEAEKAWAAQRRTFEGRADFPCKLLVNGEQAMKVPLAPPGKWWATKDGVKKVTDTQTRGVAFDRAEKYWWEIARTQTRVEVLKGFQTQGHKVGEEK